MGLFAGVLAGLVAILHLGFFVLESVLWARPTGRRIFGLSREDAETTQVLAMNQGVYNAMVAVGLGWGLISAEPALVSFMLLVVVVVGVFGAITVKPTILVLQALPALLALGAEFVTG